MSVFVKEMVPGFQVVKLVLYSQKHPAGFVEVLESPTSIERNKLIMTGHQGNVANGCPIVDFSGRIDGKVDQILGYLHARSSNEIPRCSLEVKK